VRQKRRFVTLPQKAFTQTRVDRRCQIRQCREQFVVALGEARPYAICASPDSQYWDYAAAYTIENSDRERHQQ
jgi:hypothetical protein